MYALYQKSETGNVSCYKFVEKVSLFGCNRGYIPSLLRTILPAGQSQPFTWHIRVSEVLAQAGKSDHTLIINLKPNNTTPNLSLYELADVWGYSASGWTPIMMRIRGLFIDDDPQAFNDQDFERQLAEIDDPIFSMMYLRGSVENGALVGTWTAPRASPTNSVLLWPDTFTYFASEVQKVMEEFV